MNTKLQFILFFHFLLRFVAPIVVLIGVFFAKKAKRKTTHYGQDPNVQRYVLPDRLSWFNTPDEDGWPMYEETVAEMYAKRGWKFTMWYNLGARNVAQGLLWKYGKEVTKKYRDYVKNKPEDYGGSLAFDHLFYISENNLESKTWNLGLFKVIFGWEIAHDHYRSHTETGYYAIPDISFKAD